MTPIGRVRPVPSPFRHEIERDERSADIPIGVIVPFDFELDWQYWRYLPEGVSLYFTRTPFVSQPVGVRLAREVGNPAAVARATRTLLSLDPAAMLYACSSGSFIGGLAGEQLLRERMLGAGARRAVTTSGAMLDAFRAAGVQKVALATPYTRKLSMALVDFVEEAGIEVVSIHYLGMEQSISTVSRATIKDLVREASRPEADAVFVSCTALRTHGIIATLEQELHCPVFTSNQVSLWGALDAAGLFDAHSGTEPILGDGHPMARSTSLLLDASRDRGVRRAG